MANRSYNRCRKCGALTLGFICPSHKVKIVEDEKIKEILIRARGFKFDKEEMEQIERALKGFHRKSRG